MDGASALTFVAVMLIVAVALWFGARGRRIAPRTDVPRLAQAREVVSAPVTARPAPPRPLTPGRPPSRAAVPVTRAAPTTPAVARVPRSAATRDAAIGHMLRRRGLCSPDPHP